ncbi:MAG: CoA-binding protein [Planctomycetaceae bacterium]
MHLETQIADFLSCRRFAVVGASTDRRKYGNKVFRCYLQNGRQAVPVNPNATVVEGVPTVASLSQMNPPPDAVSIITPPNVTERVVAEAIGEGIKHIWMQPGAENANAIAACRVAGVNLIHSGPCLLVVLGNRETTGESAAGR